MEEECLEPAFDSQAIVSYTETCCLWQRLNRYVCIYIYKQICIYIYIITFKISCLGGLFWIQNKHKSIYCESINNNCSSLATGSQTQTPSSPRQLTLRSKAME